MSWPCGQVGFSQTTINGRAGVSRAALGFLSSTKGLNLSFESHELPTVAEMERLLF